MSIIKYIYIYIYIYITYTFNIHSNIMAYLLIAGHLNSQTLCTSSSTIRGSVYVCVCGCVKDVANQRYISPYLRNVINMYASLCLTNSLLKKLDGTYTTILRMVKYPLDK